MASINKLMKQAMRAQQQAQETEAALAARTVEATSGGGAVKVVATCKGELKSLKIDPEAVDPTDVETLEDLVFTAVNSAIAEGQKIQGGDEEPEPSGERERVQVHEHLADRSGPEERRERVRGRAVSEEDRLVHEADHEGARDRRRTRDGLGEP